MDHGFGHVDAALVIAHEAAPSRHRMGSLRDLILRGKGHAHVELQDNITAQSRGLRLTSPKRGAHGGLWCYLLHLLAGPIDPAPSSLAVQQSGSFLGYFGRTGDEVGTAARDPEVSARYLPDAPATSAFCSKSIFIEPTPFPTTPF